MTLPFRLNYLDRAIGVVAPRVAFKRGVARAALDSSSGKRSYDAASLGRRTDGWKTYRTSADTEVAKSLVIARNRARDLTRNNPYAKKALTVWASNIVGTGIVPRAATGDEALDAQVNDLWDAWSKVADADGQLSFAGLQELMVRGMVEGGETLIRRRFRLPEDGLPVPLQLQLIEGDLLDESKTINLGPLGRVLNGVEFDPLGRRTAYWLFPFHPGDQGLIPTAGLISTPTPASEVLHLYRKERTQARGMPWGSAIVLRLRDLDDGVDAELMRLKIASCVVGVVLGADAAEGVAPQASADSGLAVKDSNGNPVEHFEPGMFAYADNGRDVKFNTPAAGSGYPEFMRIGLHSVAAGYLVPYELLSGDLSQVNFTSMRAGLNEFRTLVQAIQWLCLIPMALDPVWKWFCESAYLSGKLPRKDIAVEWDTPAFESVNPIDDANAELTMMRSGTLPLFEAIARRTGRNPQTVLKEIAAGNKIVDQLKLILDSDPRTTNRKGAEQPAGADNPSDPSGGGAPTTPKPAAQNPAKNFTARG